MDDDELDVLTIVCSPTFSSLILRVGDLEGESESDSEIDVEPSYDAEVFEVNDIADEPSDDSSGTTAAIGFGVVVFADD